MRPEEIITSYTEAINRHDLDTLKDLMSDDFLFIDSVGYQLFGREPMVNAWRKYFQFMPDYAVTVEDTFRRENEFVLLGKTQGTYCPYGNFDSADSWEIPAAWRAKVENGKITRWQVFADNTPVMDIIRRYPGMGFLGLS